MAEEKNFENKLKSFLKDRGCWYIKYWGGAKYTKEGIPDILACVNGNFFGIEIKASRGRPKLIQLVNLKRIRSAGGIGVLVYPGDWEGFTDLVITGKVNPWYANNIKLQEEWFKKLNT